MNQAFPSDQQPQGVLLVDKPKGKTSFSLIAALRKKLGVKKIGHAGTLDPFATGVVVLLVGKKYTKLSNSFLMDDKEYIAEAFLGISTDSYDCDGKPTGQSEAIPTLAEIELALQYFQGTIEQIPPMFSAKKVNGQKLYDLARKGKTVERKPVAVHLHTTLLSYEYPILRFNVACSKGTYIRSIAHELGQKLGCGAHLINLRRTRSGRFHLVQCTDGALLNSSDVNIAEHLIEEPINKPLNS